MDKDTRNLIQRATLDARRLLEREYREQLEGTFDIMAETGAIAAQPGAHLDARQRFVRSKIVMAIRHERAKCGGDAEAVQAYLREGAFTMLNRFAALKMMEARKIVLECVSKGEQSAGFREFTGLAPGLATLPDHGYRLYLECLFDEIGTELGVLFDRRDSASLLWPRRQALTDLLDILNRPELAAANIWVEDETIGWIYQYFNGNDVKEMREAANGGAPRNSRELAVRNQFFTPRYVVEFLTDNTLGRIWYEMTRGETKLKEQCRYLVRRPNEISLKPGEVSSHQSSVSSPESLVHSGGAGIPVKTGDQGPMTNDQGPRTKDSSQADLLKQPVHIPHRPLKDPRTILMLDPACGSMHFGLYAFDLFEVIYEEYWDWTADHTDGTDKETSTSSESSVVLKPLRELYPDKQAFLRDVPKLIIEHNIHGIDIDPRAAQIAGLALWLRAQKVWQRLGLKAASRPAIRRSNIVCAEPMPGEKELLREFVEREFPAAERDVFLRLLTIVWEGMQLAGEAGSLLKIEEEIRSAIAEAKQQWQAGPKLEQANLFGTVTSSQTQKEMKLDLSGITDAQFWERVEERIYTALRHHTEQAESSGGFQRRLFAEDAARGFAFIDLCRKRYDVALMNPPFGDASLPSKPYIEETYGDTKGNVYKAFVECFHARLVPAGYLGIISSRTGFFLGRSEDWRTRVVLRLFRPIALADLGSGVLDAMVEVAAYVLRSLSAPEARDLTLSIVPVLGKVVRDSQDRFSLPKWQAARGDLKRHQAVTELEHLEAHGFIQRSSGNTVRYTPRWHLVKKVTALPEPVFPPMTCIRAVEDDNKESVLAAAITNSEHPRRFVVNPLAFSAVPSSPFAYWAGPKILRAFATMSPFETDNRRACITNPAGDDQRYFRCHWEVSAGEIGRNYRWVSIARGGKSSPFYSDVAQLVDWDESEQTYRGFLGTFHRPLKKPASLEHFFKPGITWPLRAARFNAQPLPSGCIFSVAGKFATADETSELPIILGLMNSIVFNFLLRLFAGESRQQFEVGLINKVPIPIRFSDAAPESGDDGLHLQRIGILATSAWREKRFIDTTVQISHAFCTPSLLTNSGATLAERAAAWVARLRASVATVAAIQAEIDDLAFRLYGLDAADRAALTSTLATEATGDTEAEAGEDEEEEAATADATALASDLLAYTLGVAFGRWDIRYATGEQAAPELPDPFAPLPVCPPGQLQNAQGLPVGKDEVRRMKDEGRWTYPIEIPWDGILVDDPNHPLDIERRVREVIAIIWSSSRRESAQTSPSKADQSLLTSAATKAPSAAKDSPSPPSEGGEGRGEVGSSKLKSEVDQSRLTSVATAESIEHEACEILGVKTLREYFRKSFFADHLRRYSKSRRQAPIYWPLSTASGSYTVWLYYHRFAKDTLYRVQELANDKLAFEERQLTNLRQESGPNPSAGQRKQLAEKEAFVQELREFRTEIARVAPLWNPDLNDGVIINFAPLWRLIAHRPWQKSVKECWDALVAGDYDWAHLALHLWPERVVPKCQTDRSLAIAHSLDAVFWEEDDKGKWRAKKVSKAELDRLIAERTSPAVKDALKSLVEAPVAGGGKKRKRE